jgi:hypothetical protein
MGTVFVVPQLTNKAAAIDIRKSLKCFITYLIDDYFTILAIVAIIAAKPVTLLPIDSH